MSKSHNLLALMVDGTQLKGLNLSAAIPEEFTNLIFLRELGFLGNRLSGPIPREIGDIATLEELVLENNQLEGSLPENIGNLRNLRRLILSANNFSGSIPKSFGNLKNLNDFRIDGSNLIGKIPDFIGNWTKLTILNLQGTSMEGPIPSNLSRLTNLEELNDWCLKKDLPCNGKATHHSLFINCGGESIPHDGNNYEADQSTKGPSTFFSTGNRWAYSSSGIFFSNNAAAKYIVENQYGLNVSGAEYYKTARLSPQSLKYYGLCMRTGSYKVKLHFAEIMFTDNETFSSLGKRIFDVLIQGKLVLKDFNIAKKAGGVGIGITEEFKDVRVNGSTLEVHLYWAGKGTNAIPDQGVYGPLISAITVTPNFKVDTGGLSAGVIVGIVVASCAVVVLFFVLLWMKGCFGGKDLENKELRALDLQTGYFTLRQIKAATNNFDPANKIGEGGFGPVYKGTLSDGGVIAVKQLSSRSKQGNREFVNEIGMISALQHPNLVKLYGCCIEGNQLLLVYEYLENNSLARALFGKEEEKLNLDWKTRKKICIEIAKGLAYLHEESRLKIVHRDIKATNVLLDKDLNAKISDFGLAKLDEEENTHISTRIAGTIGYMAPEYAMRGYLTDKADVYSFGVVALEVVSGKSNTNYRPKEEFVYLLDWAYVLQEQGNLLELVDPSLGSKFSKEEASRMLNIALLCTNPSPTLRAPMSSVVAMLEGKVPVQAPIVKRSSDNQDARFKAFEILSQDSQTMVSTFSQESHSQISNSSIDGQWRDSSSVSLQTTDETREPSSSSMPLK
ncbi:hypothetical protein LWI29_007075 [Acer saccharum]|uniref:non-specific serine/threonine protein kinase n=1 Tax=Acer saccharum TaxID=4024 RepID=A0AA39T1G9_ACESA|nr:hypothetical protein LWI29_007075 [Acer saccharum]